MRQLCVLAVALVASAVLIPSTAVAIDVIALPGIRVTGGAVWHLEPERDLVGCLDVLPNIQVIDPDGDVYFTMMLGYGFEGGGDTHLFLIGADLGLLPDRHFGVSVGLRGALGAVESAFGGGVRAVAGLDLWYGVFRLETGYQFLGSDHGGEHDVRVSAGVDLLRLMVAPFLAMAEDL